MAHRLDSALARPSCHGIVVELVCLGLLAVAAPAYSQQAQGSLSPEARQTLDQIYSGHADAAIANAQKIQQEQPEDPLGYLLEGEARWWELYCASLNVKYGMVDAWQRPKLPGDKEFLALAQKAVRLAKARLKENDSAEMHLYAGLGWALEARLRGLRNERRATAHAGVEARSEFLQALKLDPNLADADTGLGLYNYYVDTLSGFVKIIRFFMGIPGGSKKEGIRQLALAMNGGELTSVDARFYLAKNLRTYDEKYEQALAVLQPLVVQYPQNPVFLLLRGNLYAELGRKELAAADFQAAENLPIANTACAARIHNIAETFLKSLQ